MVSFDLCIKLNYEDTWNEKYHYWTVRPNNYSVWRGDKRNNRVMPIEKNQLFDFLISLGEKHAFTLEALASLTGFSLMDDPFPNEHYSVHHAMGNKGKEHPFIKKLELRSPVGKGNPGGLIILDLCNTSHITKKDVMERFGEVSDLIVPYPEQPKVDPVVLVYK